MRIDQTQQLCHASHQAQVEVVPGVQLCQVCQLFKERDDLFFGGLLSHACLLVALVRRSDSLCRPLLELFDELSESVLVIEGVGLHSLLKPLPVLSRHGFKR